MEKKIQSLPSELQQEIFDFIDFITIRYNKSSKTKSSDKKNLASSGRSISSKELKNRIQKSEEDIQNRNVLTLKDAKRKIKTWK